MKIKKLILVLIVLLMFCGIILFCTRNNQEEIITEAEITPEEEISEEQERSTAITLYFENSETGELTKETRWIDVKDLAVNPYKELVQLLIDGPKTEGLQSTIPEETIINDINIQGETVYIDFSGEFINNHEGGIEKESNTIYSIVNTLTELNEVTFVKILIDGQANLNFKDNCMNFIDSFERNV